MTVVEGDLKALFSLVIKQGVEESITLFPGLLHFTLDLIMISVNQGSIKFHLLSLWYDSTLDWTLVHWWTLNPLDKWTGIYTYINIYIHIFIQPLVPQARCETRSIFKLSKTSLNSDLSFSWTGCLTKAKEPRLSKYSLLVGRGRWIHILPKGITTEWNANSHIEKLNLDYQLHFLWWW